MEDLSLKNKNMIENKINEIQEYFKDKIIAGDFQHKLSSNKNKIIILIDDNFVNWWVAFQCPTWEINNHCIFRINKRRIKKFIKIQEKDLKEFERIKKLYNL